jgi:hypothetical protein
LRASLKKNQRFRLVQRIPEESYLRICGSTPTNGPCECTDPEAGEGPSSGFWYGTLGTDIQGDGIETEMFA